MDADWSIELGADDFTLDFPWSARELGYLDLKQHPELVDTLSEVGEFPELAPVLRSLNGSSPWLLTAKCDVWFDEELQPAEDIYDASCRLSSYIDVLFVNELRFSLEGQERFVKAAVALASEAKNPVTSVEFVVRRCYFRPHLGPDVPGACLKERGSDKEGVTVAERDGFYVSVYVSGYGMDRISARRAWASALSTAADAVVRAAEGTHQMR